MFRASLLPTSASTSSSRSSSLRCGPPLTDASAAGLSASAVPPAGTAAAAAAIPRLSWSARYHPYWPPTLLPSRAITVTSDCLPIPDLAPASPLSSEAVEEAPTPPSLELSDENACKTVRSSDATEEGTGPAQESEPAQEKRQDLGASSDQQKDVSMAVELDSQTQTLPESDGSAQEIKLSKQQQQFLDQVVHQGQNIFLTGNAGTGKSVLTRAIIVAFRKKYDKPMQVAVTATTGVAANNIGGSTVHSWAKIGAGKEDVNILYLKLRHQAEQETSNWAACKVLIVDEISMLDGKLFDKLETLARRLKKNDRPFGGIQLVLVGDFLQLPPVPDFMAKSEGLRKDLVRFAFQSESWNRCNLNIVTLTDVFRQKDPDFIKLLNEVRVGDLSGETIRALCKRQKPITYEDGIKAVSLFPKKVRIKSENDKNLSKLGSPSQHYYAMDTSGRENQEPYELFYPDPIRLCTFLNSNSQAELELELKVGAQVMLIKSCKVDWSMEALVES